jgi:hypothetical protein
MVNILSMLGGHGTRIARLFNEENEERVKQCVSQDEEFWFSWC